MARIIHSSYLPGESFGSDDTLKTFIVRRRCRRRRRRVSVDCREISTIRVRAESGMIQTESWFMMNRF